MIELDRTTQPQPWLLDPTRAHAARHAATVRLRRARDDLQTVHVVAHLNARTPSEGYLAGRLREAIDAVEGALLMIAAARAQEELS